MSAHLSNPSYEVDPKRAIRNSKFSQDHDRFAALFCRIVVAGLVLGGMVFVRAAAGAAEGESPLAPATALAPALLVLVFVLGDVAASFRPWSGLALGLSCAIAAVLVLEFASPSIAGPGAGLDLLPLREARLTVAAYVVSLACLLAAYLSHRLNQSYGLLGALFLMTTPAMADPDPMSLWLAFYGTSALLCLFLWCESRRFLWLVAGGLGLGLAACGRAWQPAFLIIAAGPVLLVFLSRRARPWGVTAGYALVLLLSSGVAYGVWELIAASTGPVEGFAAAIFGHRPGVALSLEPPLGEDPTMGTIVLAAAHSIAAVPLGDMRLPVALTLGPAAVCFLPWAFRGKWGCEKRAVLIAVLLVVSVTGSSRALKSLGLVPIIPLLAMLAAYGIHNLYMNVRRPILLIVSVVALLIWNGVTLWKAIA